ncbi:hypothetical protein GCM10009838_63300 [Catenulispora subtropica]|uniref:Uncharacterized protein n=1 Tax=Catenulispora subtropica TaxID=450798 RepID=A0ABN2STF0_9ACTN
MGLGFDQGQIVQDSLGKPVAAEATDSKSRLHAKLFADGSAVPTFWDVIARALAAPPGTPDHAPR